jgi:RNA polymerase sigma-70 factor (ECF subfamily)
MDKSNQNLKDIIEKAKSGDNDAFSLIYNLYYTPIYKYLYVRIGNKEQAEDLTQNVFIKVYKSLSSFNFINKSPLAYFYTVARNTFIDYIRKNKVLIVELDEVIIDKLADESPDAKDKLILKEESKLLYKYIVKLPKEQQEIITLKYINSLSNKEISDITGKREDAIRKLQSRGLMELKKLFNQENEK